MHSIHDHNQVQSHKDSMAVIKIERDSRLIRLRALRKPVEKVSPQENPPRANIPTTNK